MNIHEGNWHLPSETIYLIVGKYDLEIENTLIVFWYQVYQARLWERVLWERVLNAEPGKLDIKRRAPGILFISYQICSLFKLVIMTQLSIFVSIQRPWWHHSNVQRRDDLIKAHAVI